jgi:hypothetical protein
VGVRLHLVVVLAPLSYHNPGLLQRARRFLHSNIHPTAAWTVQQFREVMDNEYDYRFVIHYRDKIYSLELDLAVRAMGVRWRPSFPGAGVSSEVAPNETDESD